MAQFEIGLNLKFVKYCLKGRNMSQNDEKRPTL